MGKIRPFVQNFVLAAASIVIMLLFFELVLFRFVLRAPDLSRPVFADGIIKYTPNREGLNLVRDEIRARVRVNANGWHSAYPRYERVKPPGVCRVALIGDSFVEATGVDFDASMAERLEVALGPGAQVYRFGISGAPLSHYLEMYRREVRQFAPDLVIVLLIHNDFSESHRFRRGVYTSSFLKLAIGSDGTVREIPPVPYTEPWYSAIRHSATWRYLAYRQQIRFGMLRDLFLGTRQQAERYEANIEVDRTRSDAERNRIATEYVLRQLARLADEDGTRLLLAMDGNREAIYEAWASGRVEASPALGLNRMVATVTDHLEIEFVDLHPVFDAEYKRHGRPFNSEVDNHWNEHGHETAARAVAERISRRHLLPGCLTQTPQ